ncbi:MAG: hypothetical protein WAS73_13575 [Defluviicoccus sp.]
MIRLKANEADRILIIEMTGMLNQAVSKIARVSDARLADVAPRAALRFVSPDRRDDAVGWSKG